MREDERCNLRGNPKCRRNRLAVRNERVQVLGPGAPEHRESGGQLRWKRFDDLFQTQPTVPVQTDLPGRSRRLEHDLEDQVSVTLEPRGVDLEEDPDGAIPSAWR